MNDLCKICGKSVKNISSLSKHIKYNHQNILLKNYYDSYLKKDGDGFCAICKRETIYIGLGVGYQITCSRKCGCIYHRKQLKKNTNKYNIFLKKVAKNQKEIWKKREDTDEKQNILNKVMTTIRHNIENMTEAERKEKFGWLNKLDEHEKTLKVKEILNKSLFKWYNESFEEEKQLKYDKRIQTMIKNGKCIDKNFLSDWDQYKIEPDPVTVKVIEAIW